MLFPTITSIDSLPRTYENICPAYTPVFRLRGIEWNASTQTTHDPKSNQEASLTISPVLSPGTAPGRQSAFGAEVAGVDWSRPIPNEIVQQVR